MHEPHPLPRQRLERRASRSVWLRVARHVSHREGPALDPGLLHAAGDRLAHADRLVIDAGLRESAAFASWRARVDDAIASIPEADAVSASEAERAARVHLESVDRSWNLVVASRPRVLAWPRWFEQQQQTIVWASALAAQGVDPRLVERAERCRARVDEGLQVARRARGSADLDAILRAHDREVERLEREVGLRDADAPDDPAQRQHLWRLADRTFELEGQLAELHDPFPGPEIGHRRRRVLDLLNRVEAERQRRLNEAIAATEPGRGDDPDADPGA